MDVVIKTFRNPFSFFCVTENVALAKDINITQNNVGLLASRVDFSDINHGQYVAVLWNNNWARGIITLESQFLIWLVDYGINLRPNEKTVYVELPPEYKKYPTKVFEASIHGVIPLEKVLNDMCQLEDELSSTWSKAAIKKGQELISTAEKITFVPIAILSTKSNDVVLGDLYIKKNNQMINFIDELEKWPVFLKKKPELYIQKLSVLYTNRRQHRACTLKPAFPQIPLSQITLDTPFDEYNALCAAAPALNVENDSDSEEGSTITYIENPLPNQNALKLTPEEIQNYANSYVTVSGREYNILNVLLNKARDLHMCEQFKDAKSVGRATSRLHRNGRLNLDGP